MYVERCKWPPPALYSSPASNPFVGEAGADEVFAYGFRNPWRFSFDRETNMLYLADVGEDIWEEVDVVTRRGNYGWRVWEGTNCMGLAPDPGCTDTEASYTIPVIKYAHANGRCSITGGYVYRGARQAVPAGSYVFGDFCTGEIFQVANGVMTVLLDTTMAIASFGEDEAGEIYVVDRNGSVSRIALQCTYAISPTSAGYRKTGGTGTVSVTAPSVCGWTAASNASWLHVTSGASGSGNGTVSYTVDVYTLKKKSRSGTITIAGKTFSVKQSR